MALIVLRLWHLTEVQYDDRVEEATKPRKRVIMEPAKRGTIRDRFNIPLAINRVQYQAGVIFNEIKQIPSIRWVMKDGKRVKVYRRKEYIHELSEMLARELGMESRRIEDLIHSKATFYFQIPFILKENITEAQYYRLNMLAKDWPGLHVQRTPRRFYPRAKVAGDVIGYMGAINKEEYEHILEELKYLREYLLSIEDGEPMDLPEGYSSTEDVHNRLKDLEAQAYTANDLVGKGGIEQQFESSLRGFHGKKVFYSDARGNFLRELPGSRPPLSGQRVLLTLSSELQEYAEELLAMNEQIRKNSC
jgi:cell division protein FtsI/penicillin-binding protein 2